MIKTIKLGKQTLTLDNNAGWLIDYRAQFGRDIVPALMPGIWAIADITAAVVAETGKPEGITWREIADAVRSDIFEDAMLKISGLELVDLINITWAMAKCADPDIPEPREWIRQFDAFAFDVIAPEVFNIAAAGVISSKNWKRLRGSLQKIRPTEPTATSN